MLQVKTGGLCGGQDRAMCQPQPCTKGGTCCRYTPFITEKITAEQSCKTPPAHERCLGNILISGEHFQQKLMLFCCISQSIANCAVFYCKKSKSQTFLMLKIIQKQITENKPKKYIYMICKQSIFGEITALPCSGNAACVGCNI